MFSVKSCARPHDSGDETDWVEDADYELGDGTWAELGHNNRCAQGREAHRDTARYP